VCACSLVGHMVAKKTPSRGHQRRCGGGKAAGGAATRTAWEHKDAATLMQGMQQDYSAQVAKEFRAGKPPSPLSAPCLTRPSSPSTEHMSGGLACSSQWYGGQWRRRS
jgi:hypothetical protein